MSLAEIEEEYDVAVNTAGRILKELRTEGLVEVSQGVRTVVVRTPEGQTPSEVLLKLREAHEALGDAIRMLEESN